MAQSDPWAEFRRPPSGAPAAAPSPSPAPRQGGVTTRTILTVPNPQQDYENQIKAAEEQRKRLEEARKGITFEQEQADRDQRGGAATTEAEKTAAFLATRVANGLIDLSRVKGADSPELDAEAARFVFGDTAANMFTSADRQRVEAAQRDILDAALTLGTGAAYTAEQLEGYRRSYFPQIGDDDATIADKRARLGVLLEAAKVKAGAAAPAIDKALAAAGLGGGAAQQAGQTGQAIPGVMSPKMVRDIPQGTQVELGFDKMGRDEISAGQRYLQERGLFPNDQAKIIAFWNANSGNQQLTVEGAKQWYEANGYGGLWSDEQVANAVNQARGGATWQGFDTQGLDEQYQQQLDALIAEKGIDPENVGRSGVAGVSSGASLGWNDEILGGLAAVEEALAGGDVVGAYEANRDMRRRIRERAMEENPVTTIAGEIAGGFAIPGMGARNAAARGGQAAVRSAARQGAALGAVAGAGYGEGAGGSVGGALIGAPLGYVVGGQSEKLLRGLRARNLRSNRNNPPPSGGGGGTPAQNVADAQRFGMDISPGDAGGRSLKVVERILDNQPGSATVMNESRNRLQGQVVGAVDDVASGFGPTTSFRGIGEAGQGGVQSWRERFNTVASKLYDNIPIPPEAKANIAGTVQALDGLTSKITSNPKLAAMLEDKRLVGYLEALRGKSRQVSTGVLDANGNPITREVTEGGSLSWNDLKQLRSRIGEEIGQQVMGEGTLKSDLRGLYAALSADMQASAAAQGPAALKAFERANTIYKQGQERLERVWKSLLGPDGQRTPEAAAATIQRIAREGKGSGDLRLLGELRQSTAKTGEWAQISNGVIRLLGQPLNSEGREFSAQTFFRNYGDMSAEAKNLLFGGPNKELRQNLDEFARVVGRIAASDGTRNASNTGMVVSGLMGVSAGGVPGLLMQTIGSYGAAKLWTNPKVVQWMTGYTRMINGAARNGGTVNPQAHAKQMERLSRIAASDSAIAADALGLQQQLQRVFEQGGVRLAAEEQDAGSNTTGSGTQ